MLYRTRMKRLLSLLIALITAASLFSSLPTASSAAPALPPYNTETRHVMCTSLSKDAQAYYTGSYTYSELSGLSGASDVSTSAAACRNNELFNALAKLMTSTHTFKTTYSGTGEGSLAYYWQRTDAVKGSNSFILFYSDTTENNSNFNREHVWPKSNATFNQSNGGSDLHHLRPTNPTVNSTRGNLPFGNVRGVYSSAVAGSCYWKTSTLFEVRDNIKGDVARILLYVYVRWGENNIYSDTGNGKKIIESLETLLEWNRIDPVDTWEMRRNDLIEQVQGNRNVFIDYPELAWKLFGRDVPAGIATPSSAGCIHDMKIASETAPDCVTPGVTEYVCTKCGYTYSRTVKALGHADEDGDGFCDRCFLALGSSGLPIKETELSDGMHLYIYHPAQSAALSAKAASGKLAGVPAELFNGALPPPEGAALFVAEKSGEGFYLKNGGKYLTSGATGNSLTMEDRPTIYALWRTEEAGPDGGIYLISVHAKYNNSTQALEYYSGGYTVYGLKNSDAYVYELYAYSGHDWRDEGTRYDAENGGYVRVKTCTLCGEEVREALPRRQGDYDYDGLLTIKDVTRMLDMISTGAPFTQDDDLDGDGRLDEADVQIELNVLAFF